MFNFLCISSVKNYLFHTPVRAYMCACAHSSLQRCTCTPVYMSMCNCMCKTHTEMMPRFPNWQVASHQLPYFRQNLQQAKPTVKELEQLQVPDSFFLSHSSEIHKKITKYWRLKCFFFFSFCVCVKALQNEYFFCHINMLVWYGVYPLWRIKVNKTE